MCNFFRPHFTAIPREDDRIATPLFHTVYLPLSLKKKKKRKILGNKTSGVPASFFMCVLNLIMNT